MANATLGYIHGHQASCEVCLRSVTLLLLPHMTVESSLMTTVAAGAWL